MDESQFCAEARSLIVSLEDFDILKEVSGGSVSHVYRGMRKSTREIVAIKKLRAVMANSIDAERFQREVNIQATCRHKFLLPLLGFVPSLDEPTLITKFVAGRSLEDLQVQLWTEKRGPLNWNTTRLACCLVGIAIGLNHLHSQGFMHRDVKPANVLLGNPPPLPLICDFGSARAGNFGESSKGVGTFVYMAPELVREHISSQKTDVYSFGMMSYVLFANRPYIKMENGQAVNLLSNRKDGVPGATMVSALDFSRSICDGIRPERPDTINDAWWETITACWNQNPDNRPSFVDILGRITGNPQAFAPQASHAVEFVKFVVANTE